MNIHFSDRSRAQSYPTFGGAIPEPKLIIPESIGKAGKVVGEYFNAPEQKLFLATTALMFQPLIDLKFADDDKKVDSAIKSASKAIAGGLTGVPIRAGFIALTEHSIKSQTVQNASKSNLFFKIGQKINNHFWPESIEELRRNRPAVADLRLKQYNKTLGTLFAVLFMIFFSNSKCDVPLTSDIQDFLTKIVKENKTPLKSFSEVYDKRSKIIKKWLDHKKSILEKIYGKAKRIGNVIIEDTPLQKEYRDKCKK